MKFLPQSLPFICMTKSSLCQAMKRCSFALLTPPRKRYSVHFRRIFLVQFPITIPLKVKRVEDRAKLLKTPLVDSHIQQIEEGWEISFLRVEWFNH